MQLYLHHRVFSLYLSARGHEWCTPKT